MKRKEMIKKAIWACACLLLGLVVIYSGIRVLETVVFSDAELPPQTSSKTIVRDGVEYFPRQDITVVMVLGIDEAGPVVSSNHYKNGGAADSVMLLIFDETNENCTVLCLNRDTMVDMDVLGLNGEYAGTTYGQLALAHTYGTGLEDSCENMRNTLENFLPGLSVDYYVSMNMDAIPILNDAVGGVTVTVTDDFSKVNPSITMGEITLKGDQVLDFVRTRKDVGDQKNVTRMQRQREYIESFLGALYQKGNSDAKFAMDTYNAVAPYIVTDCSANVLSSMLERYAQYEIAEVLSPEGVNSIVDGYYQFCADEEKLDALILDVFYAPKKP